MPSKVNYLVPHTPFNCYLDEDSAILVLDADLKLRKRKLEHYEEPEQQPLRIRQGLWEASEIQLFGDGVSKFGWGNWAAIAGFIGTRTRKQVYSKFITTALGWFVFHYFCWSCIPDNCLQSHGHPFPLCFWISQNCRSDGDY